MNKVICDVCGTDYPESAAQCPICGCARAGGQASSVPLENGEAEKSAYTYVKGGRFSKSNVRKRLKASQVQESRIVDTGDHDELNDSEQDEGQEERRGSNLGLIIVIILLLLAIIAVSIYIAVSILGIGDTTDPVGTAGPGQTTSQPASTDDPDVLRVPCTGMTLETPSVELVALDSVWTLKVQLQPENTTDKLVFISGDESVVVVDEQGNVTAVGPGETVIEIICGDVKVECPVSCVFEEDVTNPTNPDDPIDPTDPTDPPEVPDGFVLKLNRTDFTLAAKGSTWQVYRGEVDASEITWSSDNEAVATVVNGQVTAVGHGSTQIHAEFNGQKVSCWVRCPFADEEPTEPETPEDPDAPTEPAPTVYTIRINGLVPYYGNGSNEVDTSWKVGETFSLTVEDEMGARKDIQWQIPDKTVCSIEGKTVTCLAATKKMLITGEYEGVTYTVTLRISEDTAATEPAEGTE